MDMTDAKLVRQVLGGDELAFETLVRRHFDRAFRYATHLLGDAFDAEEVVQDVFWRAHRALARYEERERFEAWLFRILINQCRTRIAQRKRRDSMVLHDNDLVLAAAAPVRGGQELAEEISRALAQLPVDQREAFLLRHVDDMGYEEMSGLLGAGVSALKMRVQRARGRLRDLLSEVEHA